MHKPLQPTHALHYLDKHKIEEEARMNQTDARYVYKDEMKNYISIQIIKKLLYP